MRSKISLDAGLCNLGELDRNRDGEAAMPAGYGCLTGETAIGCGCNFWSRFNGVCGDKLEVGADESIFFSVSEPRPSNSRIRGSAPSGISSAAAAGSEEICPEGGGMGAFAVTVGIVCGGDITALAGGKRYSRSLFVSGMSQVKREVP